MSDPKRQEANSEARTARIMHLLAQGLDVKTIGERLSISRSHARQLVRACRQLPRPTTHGESHDQSPA